MCYHLCKIKENIHIFVIHAKKKSLKGNTKKLMTPVACRKDNRGAGIQGLQRDAYHTL